MHLLWIVIAVGNLRRFHICSMQFKICENLRIGSQFVFILSKVWYFFSHEQLLDNFSVIARNIFRLTFTLRLKFSFSLPRRREKIVKMFNFIRHIISRNPINYKRNFHSMVFRWPYFMASDIFGIFSWSQTVKRWKWIAHQVKSLFKLHKFSSKILLCLFSPRGLWKQLDINKVFARNFPLLCLQMCELRFFFGSFAKRLIFV